MPKSDDKRGPCNHLEQLIQSTVTRFKESFGKSPTCAGYGPGRVNLIGEHTDYNDGFVLPMAIPLYTVVVGAKADSEICTIETAYTGSEGPTRVELKVDTLVPGKPSWANYVKGVIALFPGQVQPFDALIMSSVPIGSGLSSSAALEVATYGFLEALHENDLGVSTEDKARICQKAEHTFAGMPCGLMDQFISFMGRENHAMLLDCRSLAYELIPMTSEDVVVLVINSNVKHELSGSEYSIRRKHCEEVATMLAKSSLRDISIRELETSMSVLSNEVYRLARHVIMEIERTSDAAEALKRNDFVTFGTLMTQSHCSLRDDYKVSCPELDELVEAALECESVYGSRMTGGGFGGCTVSLVKAECVDQTIAHIKGKYKGNPEFYIFRAADGGKHLTLANTKYISL